jgi:hypothetical protein
MLNLSKAYNDMAERRQQSLDFVGQDRRKIIENAQKEAADKANNLDFIAKLQDIDGVKKIA